MEITTVKQWDFEIDLEKYVKQPGIPRFNETAKLARRFLELKGYPSNLLQFVTAVRSLEQLHKEGEL